MPEPRALNEHYHPRIFRENKYVYAVLSRRAGGISVGINLNLDKVCNFGCIYCQVDRSGVAREQFAGLPLLLEELRETLKGLRPGGLLWQQPEFHHLAPDRREVRDIAFSGDGEPTTFKNFCEVVKGCVAVKEESGFGPAKVVIITNATGLDRPEVRLALEFLDQHNGEVWAKLDAGTPQYFATIASTRFPYQKILDNILLCARQRPIVIQSCLLRLAGCPPPPEEVSALIQRLKAIAAQGGRIKLVQVYTLARPPAQSIVSALTDAEVDALTARIQAEAGLPAVGYYGKL